MVAAHMDEVGFMVSGHDSDGALRFETVGGIDERILAGKPVVIGPNRVPGVIGAAPVHLLNHERRNSVVKAGQLRIDLGAETAEAARRLVKVGDRGTFATEFATVGDATSGTVSLRGKALDNRLGCASLVELVRGGPYPCELHAAFTVQEEVGLRGATVAGFAVDPAGAFVLDCTPAYDLPPALDERENVEYNTRLGFGPAIYIADRATLSDGRLVRYLQATAAAAGLPHQVRQPGGGGTDAGAIHRARGGVPSVSVSVPGRYLHGPAAIARLDDWRNTVRLMRAALENWSPKALKA
jgi:endoglucanase